MSQNDEKPNQITGLEVINLTNIPTRLINNRAHISHSVLSILHGFSATQMRVIIAALREFRAQDVQGDTITFTDHQCWITDTAYYALCTEFAPLFAEHVMQAVLHALGHFEAKEEAV